MIRCIPPLGLGLLAAVVLSAQAAEPKPNVLLVVTDDQGYWDTGVSGNPKIDTPVMDRLAAESVRFTRFYACPVCAPTRAGLMTGRYYLRTGLYNTRFGGDTMGADEITLAQLLHKAGYRTGLFGKWHLGRYSGYQPQQRGFDEFLGFYQGHLERYDHPDQLVHNGRPIEARGYVTDLFTDAAIDFIRDCRGGPFFCYLAYNAPHAPYVAGESNDGQPLGDAVIEKYLARGLPLREARIYALVDLVDQNLGRLLGAVDELGLRDSTVVLLTSDNGGVSKAYSAGLKGHKASVYEGGVRVPFFARWPGHFPAGASVDAMASHLDVVPTLCELVKLPLPADRPYDGRSILSLLCEGKGTSPHEYLYHTWDRYAPNPHNNWAVCSTRYKLVGHEKLAKNGTKTQSLELYDLLADRGETTNIAEQHPDIVRDLHKEFLRWFAEVTGGQTYRPRPIPVGLDDQNPVEIQASWATLEGKTVQYVFRGYDWDTIEAWSQPGESASWELDVRTPGRYEVTISYGRSPAAKGGRLRISAGASAVEFQPRATVTAEVFERAKTGVLSLPLGQVMLKAEVVRVEGGELMRLNRIWLRRMEP